jgi:hypothetical protein
MSQDVVTTCTARLLLTAQHGDYKVVAVLAASISAMLAGQSATSTAQLPARGVMTADVVACEGLFITEQ